MALAAVGWLAVGVACGGSDDVDDPLGPVNGGAPTTAPAPTFLPTRPTSPPADNVRLTYPEGWGPGAEVVSTPFSSGAVCNAAVTSGGEAADQAFVQVCWRDPDHLDLAEFMATTFGPAAADFTETTLTGRPAYSSREGARTTYFVDTAIRRYQVVTSAPTAARQAEVDRVLAALDLPES